MRAYINSNYFMVPNDIDRMPVGIFDIGDVINSNVLVASVREVSIRLIKKMDPVIGRWIASGHRLIRRGYMIMIAGINETSSFIREVLNGKHNISPIWCLVSTRFNYSANKKPRQRAGAIYHLHLHAGVVIVYVRPYGLIVAYSKTLFHNYLLICRPNGSSQRQGYCVATKTVSCRHTLQDEVDAPSALLRCKSGRFKGGMPGGRHKARSGYVNAVLRISVQPPIRLYGYGYQESLAKRQGLHPWERSNCKPEY